MPPERFLGALDLELGQRGPGVRPRTVFVGGGTPTALSAPLLRRFFEILADRLDLSRVVEFSVEANPEDLDDARVAELARADVGRVSLGAQSFDPATLAALGRAHDAESVRSSVRRLRAAGVARVSLDLIFGAPGQSLASLDADLDALVELAPEHVSTYGLTYEPGTALTRSRDRGDVHAADEEHELSLFRRVRSRLSAEGYEHYEVSNFARPGSRCLHNLNYWRNGPHLGFGPSAVGFLDGTRRRNIPGTAAWCAALERGDDPMAETERLPEGRALRETLMVGLRLRRGVRLDHLARRHGGLEGLDLDAVARLRRDGLLDPSPERLRMTDRGLELADHVAAELL